jgi:hypothetical protein
MVDRLSAELMDAANNRGNHPTQPAPGLNRHVYGPPSLLVAAHAALVRVEVRR